MLCVRCGQSFNKKEALIEKVKMHLKASCPKCKGFIKFLPYSEPKLHFGQYKGMTVKEVASIDFQYLRWLLNNNYSLSKRTIEEIKEVLP
jgi:predicted amidophosphoribosyltransferase